MCFLCCGCVCQLVSPVCPLTAQPVRPWLAVLSVVAAACCLLPSIQATRACVLACLLACVHLCLYSFTVLV